MRLGGPVFVEGELNPDNWIADLRKRGYTASYCPAGPATPEAVVQDFIKAAREANVIISEVGAWSNPLSPDTAEAAKALQSNIDGLAMAERVGACCCVNITGSRGQPWDGPHPDNLTQATFDTIVELARKVIDTVKPKRAFYTLETMPWMYPESPDSYLRLLKAIDRKQFAVHFDPVNMIGSAVLYFNNGAFIRDCVTKLGPYMKSVHAKDVTLSTKWLTHIDEIRLGLGNLDYRVLLTELNKLNPDLPVMLEHLSNEEDYTLAAGHIRKVAQEIGVRFK